MPAPKASFLLPAYKSDRYIALTIHSLSAQTERDFEIVAVDDGSPDRTGEILDRLARKEPRLKVIHQENRGQAAAMNRGLAECRAPYVALIDADDLCKPERLARQLAFMDAHPEVTACGTGIQLIDSDGAPLGIMINPTDHDEIERQLLSGIGGVITAPSAILRKDAVVKAGGFAERYTSVQDLDIYLRLGELGRLTNLTDVLVCYRKHLEAASFARRQRMVDFVKGAIREAAVRRGCALPKFALDDFTPKTPAGHHQEWAFMAMEGGYRKSAIKHTALAVWKSRFGRPELSFAKYALGRLRSMHNKQQFSSGAD